MPAARDDNGVGAMKIEEQGRFERLLADERGQVLPLAALVLTVLLSMMALVTDVGHALYSQRELQATTDAAALAGAAALRTATTNAQVTAEATLFSAVSGDDNARSNLPNVSMVAGYPALKCLVTLQNEGQACVGSVPYNAVQVKQQAIIPMVFAGLIGHPTVTVTASATASAHGGSPTPFNIALILDTTLSTYIQDDDCGSTELTCELNGMQVMLQNLNPCAKSIRTCVVTNGVASSPVDQVSLFTFPNVSVATAPIDYECTSTVPSNYTWYAPVNSYIVEPPASAFGGIATAVPYTTPTPGATGYYPGSGTSGTYQLLGFKSDLPHLEFSRNAQSIVQSGEGRGGSVGLRRNGAVELRWRLRNLLRGCNLCGAIRAGGAAGALSGYAKRHDPAQRWRRDLAAVELQRNRHSGCHGKRKLSVVRRGVWGRPWLPRRLRPQPERGYTPSPTEPNRQAAIRM